MRTRELVPGRHPISAFVVASFFFGSVASARGPLQVSLGYSGDPAPGQSFTVICSVLCDVDTTCVSNSVLALPVGMIANGEDSVVFESTCGDGLVAVHQFSVVAQEAGIYEIAFCSSAVVDTNYTMGDCTLLNLSVSSDPDSMGVSMVSAALLPDGSHVTIYDAEQLTVEEFEDDNYVLMDPMPADSIPNPGEPNDSLYGGPSQALGTLTVTGRYIYWAGNYADYPYENYYYPLVNASVYIWDSDSSCGDDELLGVTITDSDGYFSLPVSNGDCTGTVDVYAQARLDNTHIHISDYFGPFGPLSYMFNTGTVDNAGSGTLNLGTFVAGGEVWGYSQRACKLFRALNRAWSRIYDVNGTIHYSMRETRAWYGPVADNAIDHSYYADPDIWIDALDPDFVDPCSHEYGHAVQDYFNDYAGAECELNYSYTLTTEQCAWQEGFADFFAVAAKNDPLQITNPLQWDPTFDFPGGFEIVEYPLVYQAIPSADALKTQGEVSRALFDLFDTLVDQTSLYPGQTGKDQFSTSLGSILSLLHDYSIASSFATFWDKWILAGKPKHLPVQAIRLNEINFNTVPQWLVPIPNRMVVTGLADTLNVNPNMYDQQSSDSELNLSVQSNTNSQVTLSWISPGVLRAVFNGTTGLTDVRLAAYDGISATNSNVFRIQWVVGGGKGEDPPPDPCDGSCPIAGFTPEVTDLGPAWPNPFNPSTEFFYDLESESDVVLAIYDVSGRRVRTFVDRHQNTGRYAVKWDGTDQRGTAQPSGVYFILLRANGRQFSSKVVLLK